jgi:predicted PurR-regulated permease PerM
MESKIISKGILRAVAILVGIALLLYFLYAIQSVIIYILIAGVLSLIGRPLIFFLRRKLKFPNTLAVISTMLLMIGFIIGLVILFIPLILEQGKSLSLLEIEQLEKNIQQIYTQIINYFSSRGIDVLSQVDNIDFATHFQVIPSLLNGFVGGLGTFSAGLFSVLFISFFFMKDRRLLKNSIITLLPDNTEERFSNSLEQINTLLSKYFIGLVLQISILFVLNTIILMSFGISNAIVIAFLCALFNLLPYIGPLIGGALMFFLSMISNIGLDFQTEILPTSLWILFCFLITQLLDQLISEPIIFSKATKSHPLEIFLVIIICGILFGVIGMMVAIPTYTTLKVILKEFLSENKIVKSLTKSL